MLLHRLYVSEGCYLVTVSDGTKLEAFDETLRPRQCYVTHTKCNTAAWRDALYSAPKPVLARADESRNLTISILRATYPEDLYWSKNNNWEKHREDAKIKAGVYPALSDNNGAKASYCWVAPFQYAPPDEAAVK